MQREKPPEWREKQKGSRGIRRGQRYRLVFQFPIRELLVQERDINGFAPLNWYNGKVVFNSGFLLLADHYNFLPRACRPRRARTKGKVERMVKYLKENFFVRYRRFDSFTHVNQQLEQWIADVADKRELRQFKETPEQRFALEQEHLQPLPDTDFDTSYFDIRHVSWDSYIEVGGNRYSVPEALCGQPVSIRISLDDELRIYSNERLVASHRLCSASSGWQTVPEHHAPLWQQVSQVEHRPLSAYEELL